MKLEKPYDISMNRTYRLVLASLMLLAGVVFLFEGFQKYAGDPSFRKDSALFYVGGVLLLVDGVATLLDRGWARPAWAATLAYYLYAVIFVLLIPTIETNRHTVQDNHSPGLTAGQWAESIVFWALPLVVGLVLWRYLPSQKSRPSIDQTGTSHRMHTQDFATLAQKNGSLDQATFQELRDEGRRY